MLAQGFGPPVATLNMDEDVPVNSVWLMTRSAVPWFAMVNVWEDDCPTVTELKLIEVGSTEISDTSWSVPVPVSATCAVAVSGSFEAMFRVAD